MKREIKFRGKSLKTGEWVYGMLFQGILYGQDYALILDNTRTVVDNEKTTENTPLVFDKDDVTIVNPDTIGQYAGLKDKNGREIYEGDTAGYRFSDSSSVTGKVVWWVARSGFYIHTRENDYYELTEHCQVIDTFSDNPELLEED